MNEELKVMEEIETYEATEMVPAEYNEEPESTGNGIVGKIAIGVGLAVAGAGAFVWHKTKAKREERTIRKLEKKGYVISKVVAESDAVEESEPVSEQNEDVQEEK